MKTDIEIAREVQLKIYDSTQANIPIESVAPTASIWLRWTHRLLDEKEPRRQSYIGYCHHAHQGWYWQNSGIDRLGTRAYKP